MSSIDDKYFLLKTTDWAENIPSFVNKESPEIVIDWTSLEISDKKAGVQQRTPSLPANESH